MTKQINQKAMFHLVKVTKTVETTEEFRSIFNADLRAFEVNDAVHPKGITETAEIITIEDQEIVRKEKLQREKLKQKQLAEKAELEARELEA